MEKPDCQICGKCSSKSKGVYLFDDDLIVGEKVEEKVAKCLREMGCNVEKQPGGDLPDFFVQAPDKKPYYLEIKMQGRAFMSIARTCPEAGLEPWETVVVNTSVLERYINLWKAGHRVYLLFCIYDRPCLGEGVSFYLAQVKTLARIFDQQGDKNMFVRKYGVGDVIDGHLWGCKAKYHFSIQDMKKVKLFD